MVFLHKFVASFSLARGLYRKPVALVAFISFLNPIYGSLALTSPEKPKTETSLSKIDDDATRPNLAFCFSDSELIGCHFFHIPETALRQISSLAEKGIRENESVVKPLIEIQLTGKEIDEETGYIYFGARYYDPKVSSWVSTDPALGEYLPAGTPTEDNNLPNSGGFFKSINSNLYHYAMLNPVAFIDPDG